MKPLTSFTICLCLVFQLQCLGQFQIYPQSIQFDSTIAYIGYEKADQSFFLRNNLVIKNYDKFDDGNLKKYADVVLDTGGGISFRHMGSDIGSFYKGGLLMYDTKITRINSGIKDLLPYAYGRVDQNGVAMTGTNNWTITSNSPGVYYLEFTEVDAGDLILQATPVAGLEILFDIGIELIISYVNENTIVVKTTHNHSAVARGFTFLAFLP